MKKIKKKTASLFSSGNQICPHMRESYQHCSVNKVIIENDITDVMGKINDCIQPLGTRRQRKYNIIGDIGLIFF